MKFKNHQKNREISSDVSTIPSLLNFIMHFAQKKIFIWLWNIYQVCNITRKYTLILLLIIRIIIISLRGSNNLYEIMINPKLTNNNIII